jgi:hypothetical protein
MDGRAVSIIYLLTNLWIVFILEYINEEKNLLTFADYVVYSFRFEFEESVSAT